MQRFSHESVTDRVTFKFIILIWLKIFDSTHIFGETYSVRVTEATVDGRFPEPFHAEHWNLNTINS